ncbi:oligosaccharide flippase family protein [Fontibacter flavus]|uniref:Oligosaccharide flippase family protein n=1 Tax=Fontibacter flavus TaxID=654838 RepID=A0ABV6FRC5_9BACT
MFEKISSFPFGAYIKNKSIQNFIFLVLIQASNMLISIISMPLLIQSIGVDQFGLVNLALSVIIFTNIAVGFGFNISGPREVAINQTDRKGLSKVVSQILFSRIFMAGVTALLLLVSAYGFNFFKEYKTILVFSIILLFSEATLPLWFFQGMEKMKLISITNVFSKLLFLFGIVLFIHSPEQSKWVNFILGVPALGLNLFLLLYIYYVMEIRFYWPKIKAIWFSLKDNVYLFLSNIVSHITVSGGLIILSFFGNDTTLGMFSLSEKIMMVLRILPTLIIQAVYPNASKLYQISQEKFIRFLFKTYVFGLGAALLLSLATFFSAEFIITILAKSRLEQSITYLKILSFIPFLASLNIINGIILFVLNQKELLFKASLLMCFYMIGMSSLLTYKFGAVGLCVALLSSELVIFIIYSFLIYLKNKQLVHAFFKLSFGSHHRP